MTNIPIPSGLIDDNIELFAVSGRVMATHSGSVKHLFDLPGEFIELLKRQMQSSPAIVKALKLSGYTTLESQLEKYSECNFGGFDMASDYKDGILSTSEYHECGFRGVCPMEGVVCSFFKVNGHIITPFEIHMIKLLSTEDTLPVIAEKLEICMNTFETKKQRLFYKFSVLSRARLVALAYEYQLLNPSICSQKSH